MIRRWPRAAPDRSPCARAALKRPRLHPSWPVRPVMSRIDAAAIDVKTGDLSPARRRAGATALAGLVLALRFALREMRGGLSGFRSEEHTSELQSRENLVCRLVL